MDLFFVLFFLFNQKRKNGSKIPRSELTVKHLAHYQKSMSAGIVSIMLSDSENNRNRKKTFSGHTFDLPEAVFAALTFLPF